MPLAERRDAPTDWDAARHALAEAVRDAATPRAGEQCPRRVEVLPPASADPLAWLRHQPAPHGFWQGRGEQVQRAFAGVADCFEKPRDLCVHLLTEQPPGTNLRYYGGVRFDAARPATGGWEGFGTGAFVLPRFELVRHAGGAARLACHLMPTDEAGPVAAQAERMALPPSATGPEEALPSPTRRADDPPREQWQESVREALRSIGEGTLQKVVLARRTTFDFDAPLDPKVLLARLRSVAPEGFAFLFQPERAGTFLGVSPERLFRQRGRRVESEAVAGTRPRTAAAAAATAAAPTDEADEAALRDDLLHSDKDRREHAFVQRYIREALRPLCASLGEREPAPHMLRHGRQQHLRVRLRGRLREGVASAEVLRALHPTPAVGGVPSEAARTFIRSREPFDRGWYAAPVGWIGREEGEPAAELAVGLRSGLVREEGRRLDLFAGAGLVEGSVPSEEWDEVEQKLGNFAALFSRKQA